MSKNDKCLMDSFSECFLDSIEFQLTSEVADMIDFVISNIVMNEIDKFASENKKMRDKIEKLKKRINDRIEKEVYGEHW